MNLHFFLLYARIHIFCVIWKDKNENKTEKIELNSEISIVFMYGYVYRHLSSP